jgi:hypothetical protein
MYDLLKTYIEVNLGQDAELRETKKSGTPVANVNGACHPTGDEDKEPLWVGFRVWGKLAEATAKHLTKGRKILFTCRPAQLPPPGKRGNAVRNGAEAYLTKECREDFSRVLDFIAEGDQRVADREKTIRFLMSLVSAQIVFDVESFRYMDVGAGKARAAAADTDDLLADLPEPDDDIPF